MTKSSVSMPLKLDELIPSIRTLPALPEVVFHLVRSLEDPQLDLASLEEQISTDQALSARLLRVANSSFYGLLRQVGTVRDAAMVLGFGALRSMAIATSTVNHFAAQRLPVGFHYRRFWTHGLACGLAAELLAREFKEPEGIAFTAGLIHDIGRLVLACQFPDHLEACYEYKAKAGTGLLEAESQVLGITHSQIGAELVKSWHFPVAVVDAVAHHHKLNDAHTLMPHVVHLAEALARGWIQTEQGEVVLGNQVCRESWSRLPLPAQRLVILRQKLDERMSTIDEILGHSTDSSS